VTLPLPEAASPKGQVRETFRQNHSMNQFKGVPETEGFPIRRILLSHGLQLAKKVLTVKARLAILPIALIRMSTGE
jgi:hypothetical protein